MTYDEWRLQGPEDRYEVGTQDGDTCGRHEQPDEDAPRGYKPKPCKGVMEADVDAVVCLACGEVA
tara:strand:- start:723 stop:917 length:195 start_codon:yes stop_codon:yes gene_type:complete